MQSPLRRDPTEKQAITKGDLDRMLDEYYALRGWTKEGIPSGDKLRELGLGPVAEELEQAGISMEMENDL